MSSSIPPLDPHSVIDAQFIADLAATSQTSQMERQAQNLVYHERRARAHLRDYLATIRAELQQASQTVQFLTAQLAQTRGHHSKTERFVLHSTEEQGRHPADGMVYAKFFATLFLKIVLIVSGTITVSMAMLASPDFSGQAIKTIAISGSIVLLPAWILSVPAALLRKNLRSVKIYLACLMAVGMLFGSVFALTWALNYGQDNTAELMQDISTLGVEGGTSGVEEDSWLFRNSKWIQLFCQICADVILAGSATTYLSFLSFSYDLFRPSARSENQDFLKLDQEIRDTENALAQAEAEKTKAEDRLGDATQQCDEFVESVRAVAEARFLKELDVFVVQRQEMETVDKDIEEKLRALEGAKSRREQLLQKTPGAVGPTSPQNPFV
jgi:hypothetical protein